MDITWIGGVVDLGCHVEIVSIDILILLSVLHHHVERHAVGQADVGMVAEGVEAADYACAVAARPGFEGDGACGGGELPGGEVHAVSHP